jgi:hypothetical protein
VFAIINALFHSLRQTGRALWSALRAPGIYLLLAACAVLWALAYQHKTVYIVDIGGLTDDAYVSGFHAKEHNDQLSYRWTTGRAEIFMPGLGNQRLELELTMAGFRTQGSPPTVTVQTRAGVVQVHTSPDLRSYTFFVDRGDRWNGDLQVVISSSTFSPAGDPRPLGVLVDRMVVRPLDYSLRSVVIPPTGTMVSMLAGLALLYLSAAVTTRRGPGALWVVVVLGSVAAVLIVFARAELGLLAGHLPSLGLWAVPVAIAGRTIMDLLVPDGLPARGFVAAAASSAFVAAFLLRFGGLTYPQFLTSDILLHVHYIQDRVLRGEWVFPGRLPDGTPVPYPPALYIIVAPLTSVFGTSDAALSLVLKWAASALDSTTCLALGWAASRLWSGKTGGWAALAYAVSPAPFELFSAGNYTNLFAQSVFNLTLLTALVFVAGPIPRPAASWGYPVLIAVGFALTMLGHYGMMLSTLVIMGLYAVWALLDPAARSKSRPAWSVVLAFGVALFAGWVFYYRHFATEMRDQLVGVLERLSGGRSPAPRPIGQGPMQEPLLQRFARKLDRLVGTLPLLDAAFGGILPADVKRSAQVLLASWLAASGFFFLLDQTLGDAIRWFYLAAAPVSLLAGRYLAHLTAKGRSGVVLAGLVLSVMTWNLLVVWIGELIFTRYH